MNNLCVDVGWKSINHEGEQLCGDHIEIVDKVNSTVVVLADGLGSGVKASILSTLTSKIISTMIAEGQPLEECVSTIAETLPVCKDKGVAYSTFTILHIVENDTVEIIQYDNPPVIFLRDGEVFNYPKIERSIEGKTISKSVIRLREDDCMIAMSDGCPYAGTGASYNYDWTVDDIAEFMKALVMAGYTAKNLASMLIDQVDKEYGHCPSDDATACVVRLRRREPVNLLFGPPRSRDDCGRMMSLFFAKEGRHIVCGGTTASIAAEYLGKRVRVVYPDSQSDVPPVSEIEGVDLVTEGILTVSKVLDFAKDALDQNALYEQWGFKHDGASMIARYLFEDATDINMYVGRAVNPAYQDPDLPISFNIKMNLAKELADCLKRMGKHVKLSFF